MSDGVSSEVQLVMAAIYAALLLWWASARQPAFASWHMFASLHRAHFRLTHPDGTPFNPWKYLPHTYYVMPESEARLFLAHLEQNHGLLLDGEVVLWRGEDCYTRTVTRSDMDSD